MPQKRWMLYFISIAIMLSGGCNFTRHLPDAENMFINMPAHIGLPPHVQLGTRTITTPSSPDPRFSQVEKILADTYQKEWKKIWEETPDTYGYSNVDRYVKEVLFLNASHVAEDLVEKFPPTWRRIEMDMLLAKYFAIHGDCKKSEKFYSEAMQNPDFSKYYPTPVHLNASLDRQKHAPVISGLISSMEICGAHSLADTLIKSFAIRDHRMELVIGGYVDSPEYSKYRGKVGFLLYVYTEIGVNLVHAGYPEEAKKFFAYAQAIFDFQNEHIQRKEAPNVYENLLSAGMPEEAEMFFSKTWMSSERDYAYHISLMEAYGLKGNTAKVFELGKSWAEYPPGVTSEKGAIPSKAIRFLLSHHASTHPTLSQRREYLDELESFLKSAPYKNAINIGGLLYLAQENAISGRQDRANDLLEMVNHQWKKYHSRIRYHWEDEYIDHIAKTYAFVDRAPYRVFDFLTRQKYRIDMSIWGVINGAAALVGDTTFPKRMDTHFATQIDGIPRKDLYMGAEIGFYVQLKEFDRALALIKQMPSESERTSYLKYFTFSALDITQERLSYLND